MLDLIQFDYNIIFFVNLKVLSVQINYSYLYFNKLKFKKYYNAFNIILFIVIWLQIPRSLLRCVNKMIIVIIWLVENSL